jgi:tripartite-type tricarboxylate transporter receptor subunit TctC
MKYKKELEARMEDTSGFVVNNNITEKERDYWRGVLAQATASVDFLSALLEEEVVEIIQSEEEVQHIPEKPKKDWKKTLMWVGIIILILVFLYQTNTIPQFNAFVDTRLALR